MQVARSFQKVEVAHRLETVLEDALERFLRTAPQDPEAEALYEWQLREIETGLQEAELEEGIDQDQVVKWVQSWETENELPMPK